MSDLVSDAGVFIPTDRMITIGGKEFDLSEVPFEFSLRFYELLPIFEKLQAGTLISSEDYKSMFPVIYDLLKFLDDSVDEKWLRRKITIGTFSQIITSVFVAVFDDGKKNGDAEGAGVLPLST